LTKLRNLQKIKTGQHIKKELKQRRIFSEKVRKQIVNDIEKGSVLYLQQVVSFKYATKVFIIGYIVIVDI